MKRREFLKTSAAASALTLGGASSVPALLSQTTPTSDVIIIGAGLAGLYAAMLLEEQGKTLTVLEGNSRIGGRLSTLPDDVGKPFGITIGDTGGVEVGDGYTRVVGVAQKLGVALEEPKATTPQEVSLNLRTVNLRLQDWLTSPMNKLPQNERKLSPMVLESALMQPHNPLKTLDDWYSTQFAPQSFSQTDVSVAEFLRSKGASDEALRLINMAANTNDITTTSALNVFRSLTFRTLGGSKKTIRIAGGSSRLPEAMAKSLKSPVLMNKMVQSIAHSSDGVTVGCADGSTFKAKNCIVTIPFPVLRQTVIAPALTGAHAEAIRSLPYTAITQIYLAPKSEFWLKDGFAPTMWTDSPLERVFAIQRDGRVNYFTVWLNGLGALRADAMPTEELKEFVLKEMAKLRPASAGQLEVAHIQSWGKNPFSGGAYCHFAPGQASKFMPAITQPVGRLIFAGEHTALQNNGMEGAMESGERAAKQVLAMK